MNFEEIDLPCLSRPDDEQAFSIALYNGALFFGTRNERSGAKLVRIDPDRSSVLVWNAEPEDRDIYGLTEYRGKLYFGTFNPDRGGRLFACDGTSLPVFVCENGIDDPGNQDIYSLATYERSLYVGTWHPAGGGKLYCSDDAIKFRRIFETGTGDHGYIRALVPWQDCLWGSVGLRCEPLYLLKISSDAVVEKICCSIPPPRSDIFDMTIFNDRLYLSLSAYHRYEQTGGAEVWRFDGTACEPCSAPGFGNANNFYMHSMTVHGGNLYAATYNYRDGCEIWRSGDGTSWQLVLAGGFGCRENESIVRGLISYAGRLWAITRNTKHGARVYVLSE